jgi:transcriptional regulator with XRE-family HTH domain
MAKKWAPPDPRWWNMRQALSTNLKNAMDHHYEAYGNRPAKLNEDSGVSDTVIRRLIHDPHGLKEKYYYPTIETLAKLADALHVTVESLLHDPNAKTPPAQPSGGGSGVEPVHTTTAETEASQTPKSPLIHEPA